MKGLFRRLGRFAAERPLALVALAVLFTVISFKGAGMIGFASGTDTFVEKDTQLYQVYDTYQESFLEESIVLLVEADDATVPGEVRAIRRFDSSVTGLEGVQSVSSLSDYVAPGGDLPSTEGEIDARLSTVPAGVLRRLMPDSKRTFVMVELESGITDDRKKELYSGLQGALEWSDFPPGTETTLTGSPVFMVQMQRAMQRDLGAMFLAAAVLMVLALTIFFGNVEFRFLPLAIVLVGVFWTFGGMGLIGVPMTMVSMAIFPILVGLGIDYAVQFHSRAQEESRSEGGRIQAVAETYGTTGPAVLVAMIATGMGFVAMMTSPIPMIRDFGLMSLIGISAAYLAVVLLLVPVLLLVEGATGTLKGLLPGLPSKVSPGFLRTGPDMEDVLGGAAVTAAKHPVPILLASVLLMSGGFAVSGSVDVTVKEEALIPQDLPALLDIQKFQEFGGGGRPISVVVRGDVLEPDTLEWMREFEQYQLQKNPYFVGSRSVADVVAEANGGEIPESRAGVERALEAVPDSAVEGSLDGNTRAVISFELPGFIGFEKVRQTIDSLENDLEFREPPPGLSTSVTGDMVLMTTVFDAVARGRTGMITLAFLLIFLGLLVVYRDPLKALVPVVPLSFVVGWNGGAMFLTGTDYTPLTATLGALTIGVGSEYTILMMERYFEEREELPPLKAMEKTASRIGRAITVSAATTVFGFSALMASEFPMVQNFGRVTVITVVLALVAAFFVLPPILVALDPLIERGLGSMLPSRLPHHGEEEEA